MTTPTKTRTAIYTGTVLTAGAGNNTSASQNLSAIFESQLNIRLTNGATGPAIPAQVQIQVANDTAGTLWVNYGGALVADVTNSAVFYVSATIPIGVSAVRLIAGSNTGQNVTIDADIGEVTGIA